MPRTRVEVGMVRAPPEAAVRTSPPAVVKEAAEIGSIRKIGCAEADTRQTARVKAIKPWDCELITDVAYQVVSNLLVEELIRVLMMKTLTITFMVKLLIFCFCGRRKRTTDWRVSDLIFYTNLSGRGAAQCRAHRTGRAASGADLVTNIRPLCVGTRGPGDLGGTTHQLSFVLS